MYELLQKYITDRIETDEETLNLIFSKFKPLKVRRNTFLLIEGGIPIGIVKVLRIGSRIKPSMFLKIINKNSRFGE